MAEFSLTTFSSQGTLPQIENALVAVSKGETTIGIKAKNGVVLLSEKKLTSILVDEDSFHKIELLTPTLGVAYSGLTPDFRALLLTGRKKCQEFFATYEVNMNPTQASKQIASVVQEYTVHGGVRPFGISLLLAGMNEGKPYLYQIDPSGSYFGWKATVIGKNSVNMKNFIEKRYKEDMELDDAIHTGLLTLKENYEGEMNEKNIEVGVIGMDGIFRVLKQSEIKDYLKEAE